MHRVPRVRACHGDRHGADMTGSVCVCVGEREWERTGDRLSAPLVWCDCASDAAHSLDLDSCLLLTPAEPDSLINRTDEDRLLLSGEEKK